jgi:hypothetical protein
VATTRELSDVEVLILKISEKPVFRQPDNFPGVFLRIWAGGAVWPMVNS